MKKLFLLTLLVSIVFSTSRGQVAEDKITELDNIFSTWNSPGHPGGTVGVMKDGELIYCESFGLASLEYLAPNSNSTKYNIASVSKQFTSYGILLMEKRGLLNTTDDVHKYIPELPDFGKTITLENMMHHTSGMRSLHTMLLLAGWRSDDLRTNDDLMRFMLRQNELNFDPGAEYMYCNTGYILLSEIIERISGESFASWMEKNVFVPMGMYDTYVEDKYNRVVTQNATSYSGSSSAGFVRSIDYWGYVGSGNIHSTVRDILIWNSNFYTPSAELSGIFEKMERREILNSGDTIKYAFGVNVDKYKGNKRISHSGSIGGFRAFAETFPDDRMSIAILSNFSSSSVSARANSVADLVLESTEYTRPRSESIVGGNAPKELTYEHSSDELRSMVGEYYSPELMTSYYFTIEDNRLKAYHNRHGYINLKSINKDLLEGSASYFRDIKLIRNSEDEVIGLRVTNSRVRDLWFEKK